MRTVSALCLLALAGSPAQAQAPKRMGAPESPIAASVEVPEGSRLVYVSGQVPEVANAAAPEGSVERFGDTEAQTRSVIRKIEAALNAHGLGLADRASRDALAVVVAAYEFHGGFRLRTLSA